MSPILSLPLALILVGLPHLPGLPGVPGLPKAVKDIRKHLPRHVAPLDSLPPAWKPAPLLALENQFVRARLAAPRPGQDPWGLKFAYDPRQVRVSFDADSGTVRYATGLASVEVGEASRAPVSAFARDLTRTNFDRLWRDAARQQLQATAAGAQAQARTPAARTGMSFELPSPLPKRVQSLLGPGGPSLNISGSESIRLSGQSDWTNQTIGLLGQKRSLFPSLDMQQDLDIHLEGRLSDRVGVNLLQNSANQIPLENRIAINYKGDEDDLVQSLDLGNTSLTLPGTQYVSYSGKNEGLFGMKATTRMGPLDVTMLASKQEGRSERASYAGGSSSQFQTLLDKDYVRGVYFILYDPNVNPDTLQDIDESTIRLYLDEGTYVNQISTVRGRAFVDPNRACTDPLACPDGPDADTAPDTTQSLRGTFRLLKLGADQDYEIMGDVYGPYVKVIRMRTAVTGENQKLAVTYRYRPVASGQTSALPIDVGGQSVADTIPDADGAGALTMKLLRAPLNLLPQDASGNFDTNPATAPFAATRELELKNFYHLSGQRIDPKTFQIAIRKGDDVPPRTTVRPGVPYIQVLGLDNYDETSGFVDYSHHGHDNRVDGTAPTSNFRAFVDFDDGILFFPDPRPFAPRVGSDAEGGKPFDRSVDAVLFRDERLVGPPGSANEANPAIYDKRTVLPTDREYSIDVQFTAAQASNEISLGRTNIIEGSEVVTINGQPLTKDRDYRIDYDLGRVTLIRQLGPADQVNVGYSYAPLFQQAGRTLVANSFRYEGPARSFGGAFLYESKGAQDLRPRLGEEPSRVLIGDLNTEWHFKPDWITRLVDRLPGVRTTAPSEFNVAAEVGASFPNPNTRNEVFIDDMEGVRDAVSVSMTPERWRWTSIPQRNQAQDVEEAADSRMDAEIHWYSPLNVVKERELKPSLSNAEGAQNTHQSLAISLPRRPTAAVSGQLLWAGLTYPIDPVGIDLSRAQFIDVWVNDFRDIPRVRNQHVKLHIDLGAVSEDERRAPNIPPNGHLDSEDKPPRDNLLTVTDSNNEDTGLDNLLDAGEGAAPTPDLVTVSGTDPSGDDFQLPDKTFDNDLDTRKWRLTNGTEGNKNFIPIPDTEDLNLNNALDTQQNYFEYTIDLGDTTYLETDVYHAYVEALGARGVYENDKTPIPSTNGWRRFRIPIEDGVKFGLPDLTLTRHVRVWLDDVLETDPCPANESDTKLECRPFVMLGGLDVVGSRWFAVDLDSVATQAGTTVTINSVNTIDNADSYAPPFDPGKTRSGNQELTRREQSLSLEFTNLQPGGTVEAYKTFSLDEDYSRYGKLNWFAAGFDTPDYDPATDALEYYVRFASDEKGSNYYEVRGRVPQPSVRGEKDGNGKPLIHWAEVLLTLTDLSNRKLSPAFPKVEPILDTVPGTIPNQFYVISGRPSFTRIRRISFGMVNSSGKAFSRGQVWLDELRAVDVAKDAGSARRVSLNGRLANLFSYNLAWNGTDENFQSVGQSRGSGNATEDLNLGTSFDLHRFFEGTGILLPVSFGLSSGKSSPRFTAGDDVIRTGAAAAASESRLTTRTVAANYSRSWSDRSNPFLRYTLGGISASISRAWSQSRSPISVDSSKTLAATVSYGITPRRLLVLPLPALKTRFYPLPERFWWNYSIQTSEIHSYDRLRDTTGALVLRTLTNGRTAGIDFGADSRPFDFFHHRFSAYRNLTLPEPLREQIGFINLGKVVRWDQSMDGRVGVQQFGPWVRPSIGWNSRYSQNNGPELSSDLSVRSISNGQSITMNWDFPLDRVFPAKSDTSRARRGFRPWAGRLSAVSTDMQFNRGSSFSRLSGTPGFLYLVGVSTNPGLGADTSGRVRPQFGNRSDDSQDWRAGARTSLNLGWGSVLSTRGGLTGRRLVSNGVTNRSRSTQFPDLDMEYGKVAQILGLGRVFVEPRLKTTYSRSQSVEYFNSTRATSLLTTSEWRPLLGVTGDLKNGTRTELRIERRITQSENRLIGRSVTTDRNTDLNFSMSRAYTKGQRVNVLGKETVVKSNINLGMTAVYSRHTGETTQAGFGLPQQQTGTDRLTVNGQGSYGFSSNVTGNLELGFEQRRDLQRDFVNRSLRLELRAQFVF